MKYFILAIALIFSSGKTYSQLASDLPTSCKNAKTKQKTESALKSTDSTLASRIKVEPVTGTSENKKQTPVDSSAEPVGTMPPRITKAININQD